MKKIRGLAPFLSRETLDKLVLKMTEDGKVENCVSLYPFLSSDTLYKLADILVKKYGFNSIKDLAPFL